MAKGPGQRIEQLALFRHGGLREGAGRKPGGPRALTPRDKRPPHVARLPVFVTVRLCDRLPSLRRRAEFEVLASAFRRASERSGFRVVHGSVQTNHVHLIVEADGRKELASGMNGLLTRVARGLNSLWRRRGKVFADRYHGRALRTPREVRNTLVYVLHNARKHGGTCMGVDPYSSGPWFDGWNAAIETGRDPVDVLGGSPFAVPRTWMLRQGWKRRGGIGIDEVPASARPREARSRARTSRIRR